MFFWLKSKYEYGLRINIFCQRVNMKYKNLWELVLGGRSRLETF